MHLQLTPRNEAIIRSYIARTRLLRFTGALLGVFAPWIYQAFVGAPPPVPVDFGLFDALVGYLLGAVIAELTVKRPKADQPSASLMPRELSDYVPTTFITAFRMSVLVALVLVPLYRLLPARQNLVDLNDFPPEIVILPTILLIGLAWSCSSVTSLPDHNPRSRGIWSMPMTRSDPLPSMLWPERVSRWSH